MKKYLLNLNQQSNGDYEVHHTDCYWKPTTNYEDLGNHENCQSAIRTAKNRHPFKKINGCKYCSPNCHTS